METDRKKIILIVDDETDFVELLELRLRHVGYDVIGAFNGEEGLKKAFETEPDLIILDINMPKMNGLQFYKEICTEYGRSRFPVLVLTARGELKELFHQIDADGFMSKPFETDELLAEIRRVIEESSPVVFFLDTKDNPRLKDALPLLARERYKPFVVENLRTLKERAGLRIPDYVFMEYMQDQAGGEEIIREARGILSALARKEGREDRPIPLIVYSYSGFDFSQKSLAAGADRFIGKPEGPKAFVSALKESQIKKKT
ncbi:MAG: response regulator [Candidatus Omnitrophica bacterium]|nr:response regulator [Candidatus Omnitrophota bacterium]